MALGVRPSNPLQNHKTNNTEASSIASSEQSLVSASGYKFKRGDKRAGRLKLKKATCASEEGETNQRCAGITQAVTSTTRLIVS